MQKEEKQKIRRRNIRIGIVVILIIIGVALYWQRAAIISYLQEKSVSYELSDRSRARLAESETLNDITVESSPNGPTTVDIPECFSMVIPYHVGIQREEDYCNWHFQIFEPRGFIAVSVAPVSYASHDDNPSVRLRRTRLQEYTERTYTTTQGDEYLIFERTVNGKQISGFRFTDKGLFTITLSTYTLDPVRDDFSRLLDSVTIQ